MFFIVSISIITPSRSLPGLSVGYSWPDVSARVIEQEVTSKLEGLFSGVKGIKEVSSVSAKGYGYVNLSFKKRVTLTSMDMNLFQNQLSTKKMTYAQSLIDYKIELLNLKIQSLYDFEKNEAVIPENMIQKKK